MDVKPIRRVVTGHDKNGKAVVIMDAAATQILQRPSRAGVALTNLWQTNSMPASYAGSEDPLKGPLVLHPPKHGTIFRIVQFDPEDRAEIAKADGKAAFAAMGAAHSVIANARHPFMHRTETVDYAMILQGSITMLLDDQDVEVKAGDVVIQRGTNHAWSNRGKVPCLVAFVLVDADRTGGGHD